MAREQRRAFPDGGVGRRTYLGGVGAAVTLGVASIVFDDSSDEVHRLAVVGSEAGVTNYEVTVSESITAIPETSPQGPTKAVEDALGESVHHYSFDGELTSVFLTGPGTLRIDGRPVDPDSV